jgi:hypothetical protein
MNTISQTPSHSPEPPPSKGVATLKRFRGVIIGATVAVAATLVITTPWSSPGPSPYGSDAKVLKVTDKPNGSYDIEVYIPAKGDDPNFTTTLYGCRPYHETTCDLDVVDNSGNPTP